jgi:hypothetical protein
MKKEEKPIGVQLMETFGLEYEDEMGLTITSFSILRKEDIAKKLGYDLNKYWGRWKLNRFLNGQYRISSIFYLNFSMLDDEHVSARISQELRDR